MRQGSPVQHRRCPRNCKRRDRGMPLARATARPGRRRGRRPRARRPPHRAKRDDSSGGGGGTNAVGECGTGARRIARGDPGAGRRPIGKSRYAECLVLGAAAGDLLRDGRGRGRRDGGAHRRPPGTPRPLLADGRGAAGARAGDRCRGVAAAAVAGRLPDPVAVQSDARRETDRRRDRATWSRHCALPPGRSCWSPTRSAWAWCPGHRSAAAFATPPARSIRQIAALADQVVFIAAGLPLILKEG